MKGPVLILRVRPSATREIAEQAAYYRQVADAALAQRWRYAVNDAIRSLRKFPERGSPLNSIAPELHSIRRLHIQGFPKHLIFYRFNALTGVIRIISVLHGLRDIEALLKVDVLE